MRGVEPERCQHRHQLTEKIFPDPLLLRCIPLAAAQEAYAFGRKLRQHFVVEHLILTCHQLLRICRDLAEYLAQRHAVGAGRRVGGDFLLEARDADFEKLVEVAVDDAQKAQPLQRGHAAVLGERQHAAVEVKLPELAIEIELGGGVSFSHCRNTGSVSLRRARGT